MRQKHSGVPLRIHLNTSSCTCLSCPPVPQDMKEICSRSMTVATALTFPECCPIQGCMREIMWNLVTGLTIQGQVGGLAGGDPNIGIGALSVKGG